MSRILYVALFIPFIFSGVHAASNQKSEVKTPFVDILFNNDWTRFSTFDSVYIQNQNIPKQKGEMHFILTGAEQQRIAELLDSVNFWSIPRYVVGNRNVMPNPGKQMLRIRTTKADKIVMWSGVLMDAKTAGPIDRIKAVLDSIVRSRPEWKKLPPPVFDRGYNTFMSVPEGEPVPLSH
jgi:hypothetical protein